MRIRTSLFLVLMIIFPMNTSANELIIKDEGLSETIIREHFSLYVGEDMFLNLEKLHLLMKRLEEEVYREPVNAMLDDHNTIISGKPGVQLDREQFIQAFFNFYYSQFSYQIKIPKKTVYPNVDSELLDDIRKKQIGSYVTYYRTNNKERAQNISIATEAINNYVLLPGELFSFNKVVGKRTKERGYMRAPVIVKGELSEDIGGGICQVSSTLFNAVDLIGVEIIERYQHSRNVPYVPPGRDATVSWWGPDFVFKNNYSHPLLIRAKAKNGRVSIQIFTSEQAED